jgi:hypothetical protein
MYALQVSTPVEALQPLDSQNCVPTGLPQKSMSRMRFRSLNTLDTSQLGLATEKCGSPQRLGLGEPAATSAGSDGQDQTLTESSVHSKASNNRARVSTNILVVMSQTCGTHAAPRGSPW